MLPTENWVKVKEHNQFPSEDVLSHVLNPCVHVKQGGPCKGVAQVRKEHES